MEKIHQATREIFSIGEEPVELTNLKKVWGLKSRVAEGHPSGEGSREAEHNQRYFRICSWYMYLSTGD